MAKRSTMDQFANRAFVAVTMSAANTLTFQQIRFAVGTFQGIGLVLHGVEYHLTESAYGELEADADRLTAAICLRDDLSNLDPTNQAIIDRLFLTVEEHGTVGNATIHMDPIYHDLTGLPGGGLLIPANPMFIALTTAGFASAETIRAVLYFTFRELSDQESIELLQTIIPGNV